MREAMQRREKDAAKLKALRAQIRTGAEALERGEYAELGDTELESYLEGLAAAPRKRGH